MRIRVADVEDLPVLQEIERAAGQSFRDVDMPEIVEDEPSHWEISPDTSVPARPGSPPSVGGRRPRVHHRGRQTPRRPERRQPPLQAAAGSGRPPPTRFHDLRHSCLSLLAESGEPIRDLQALAGHASAAFTLQRYTHHYDSSASRTARAMDEALG